MPSTKGALGRSVGAAAREREPALRVAIVDYGAGNLVSIRNALALLGAEVSHRGVARGPRRCRRSSSCPAWAPAPRRWAGCGAAASAEPIVERVRAGAWYVGICLGCSCCSSAPRRTEPGCWASWRATSSRIPDAPRLPAHRLEPRCEVRATHPVLDGLPDGTPAYFVHSYAPVPADPDDVVAETEHGGRFASLIARERIVGFQFHPERSGDDGLRMLAQHAASSCAGRRRARTIRRSPPTARGLMLLPRVIPCLDVKDGRVVKGVRFVDLTDEGDPPELAARYAAAGADEICFLDITAAPEGRGTLLDVVERTASRVFVPLTVGGGVRSATDMREVLRAGADKVAVNTAAVADPEPHLDLCAPLRPPVRRHQRGRARPAREARRAGRSSCRAAATPTGPRRRRLDRARRGAGRRRGPAHVDRP